MIESGIPVQSIERPQVQEPHTQNVIRQDVPTLKHYYNEGISKFYFFLKQIDWGISFTTPPTWFYNVNEHVPVVLSSLSAGLIFTRMHRPQSEKDIKVC